MRRSTWISRHTPTLGLLLLSISMGAASHAGDTALPDANETMPTEAAVLAVEDHWSLAEASGDTAFLEQMLLPEYRSVNVDGKVHSKADLLASAEKHRGAANPKAVIDAYRKDHPSKTTVVLRDGMAIVSFHNPASNPQWVKSSDIFLFVDGHWHAVYSQHSQAGNS
ncbi:nuclear transport factor 2 family protein [Dyella silvatica]|uniref:nuclear transport factor 2 family protein n=1 Tax=Dyella silvatica TaxID=2992128 RepID=UPI0022598B58|nr:nuclear transport factor 2 family protein [Dyella silvatica]